MRDYVKRCGLSEAVIVDSAGLEGYHEGEPADARMRAHAIRRGYNITHISRPLVSSDWDRYDMIIGMDNQNIRALNHRAPNDESCAKISRMTNYCKQYYIADAVPDPYYGGAEGFEYVIDLLEDACAGLLEYIKKEL